MTEVWKRINYDYEVSSLGNIRRSSFGKGGRTFVGKLLKPMVTHNGYLRVCLGSSQNRFMVHRLVATAFLGKRPSGKFVNHKNLVKTDNAVCNLEYVTCKQNTRHAQENGAWTIPANSKLSNEDVQRIRKLYSQGKHTQKEIAKIFGVDRTTIGCVVRGKTWQLAA